MPVPPDIAQRDASYGPEPPEAWSAVHDRRWLIMEVERLEAELRECDGFFAGERSSASTLLPESAESVIVLHMTTPTVSTARPAKNASRPRRIPLVKDSRPAPDAEFARRYRAAKLTIEVTARLRSL